MGWKSVKEHYRIGHIVHVRDGNVCIGSPYITDIIVAMPDGTIHSRLGVDGNADLQRHWEDMREDPETLKMLIAGRDVFKSSKKVYTYDGATIIEKECEDYGFPNVTHDGELMYDNTFWKQRSQAIKHAKENAAAWTRMIEENIERLKGQIKEAEKELAEWAANVKALAAM